MQMGEPSPPGHSHDLGGLGAERIASAGPPIAVGLPDRQVEDGSGQKTQGQCNNAEVLNNVLVTIRLNYRKTEL